MIYDDVDDDDDASGSVPVDRCRWIGAGGSVPMDRCRIRVRYLPTNTLSSSIVFALLCIGTLVMAFQTYSDFTQNRPAIIFAETTEVKSEPNMGSTSAFEIHEGTKVQIIDEDEDWARIRLADGKDGWIPFNDFKQL